jgi:putative transposase
MSWKAVSVVDQREQFAKDCLAERFSIVEACQRYGISRKTGYKWLDRYTAHGREGLEDQSRRPEHSPTQTDPKVVQAILALRERHPTWGAKKLRARLQKTRPNDAWPAESTIARLLKQAGLVEERHRRRAAVASPPRPDLVEATGPNIVWTADFKGQFRTQDGRYCYPLTIMDRFSRYLLDCHGLCRPTGAQTRTRFRALFDRYGLPAVIRTDNGTPFSSTGLAGLSQLAVWWLQLGIRVQRIRPATPSENGRHERFHRTLKRETARPPARHCRAQNERFRSFGDEYNFARPHEALAQRVPGEIYEPSARPYPARLLEPEYAGHFEIRRVGSNGCIHFAAHAYFLTETLEGQDVGLEEIDDRLWTVYFFDLPIARIDERTKRVDAAPERRAHSPVTDRAA